MNSIVRLFSAFPASGRANEDVLKLYTETLAEYPIEVAEDAVEMFVKGRVEGYTADFVPPLPKLCRVLEERKIVLAYLAERRNRPKPAPAPALAGPPTQRMLKTEAERSAFVRKLLGRSFSTPEKNQEKTK